MATHPEGLISKDKIMNKICSTRCGYHQTFNKCSNPCETILLIKDFAPECFMVRLNASKTKYI